MTALCAPVAAQDLGRNPQQQQRGALGAQLEPAASPLAPGLEERGGRDVLGQLLGRGAPETVPVDPAGVALVELAERDPLAAADLLPQLGVARCGHHFVMSARESSVPGMPGTESPPAGIGT